MATTILSSNLKGGVGKTTTAVSLAACLSKKGYKSILIDLDPQGNASKQFGLHDAEYTISDLLIHNTRIKAMPVRENLVMIPCNFKFSRFETEVRDKLRREEILKKAIEPVQDRADYIIIDCPPSLGLATVNAYSAADHVIIPLEAQLFAIDGLMEVMKLIKAVQSELNPKLSIMGILFTRHRKNVILNKDILKAMSEEFPHKTFETVIRENVALRESPHQGKTIIDYDPESNGAKDYSALTEEIVNLLEHESA